MHYYFTERMTNIENVMTQVVFEPLPKRITYLDSILFIGSCFSENIAKRMSERKFQSLTNPHGILFDTFSIESCLKDIISLKSYTGEDLFQYNEIYHSWNHHSNFSHIDKNIALQNINETIKASEQYLKKTNHIVITLGSAFSYYHIASKKFVANCHKVAQKEFEKKLATITEIGSSLESIYSMIKALNPATQIIITISPVRHLRDGVINNNRSKARLIEAVYQFQNNHPDIYYFPSYELVIDCLRDYRFYDIDFAHPNTQATNIVFDYFTRYCIDNSEKEHLEKFYQLHLATKHRSRFPETNAHKAFLKKYLSLCMQYKSQFPHLNFDEEIHFFQKELNS